VHGVLRYFEHERPVWTLGGCGMKLRRVCVCVCVWGKGLECESEMRNGTEESRGRKETRGDGQG
jgi:hypothetical protein